MVNLRRVFSSLGYSGVCEHPACLSVVGTGVVIPSFLKCTRLREGQHLAESKVPLDVQAWQEQRGFSGGTSHLSTINTGLLFHCSCRVSDRLNVQVPAPSLGFS